MSGLREETFVLESISLKSLENWIMKASRKFHGELDMNAELVYVAGIWWEHYEHEFVLYFIIYPATTSTNHSLRDKLSVQNPHSIDMALHSQPSSAPYPNIKFKNFQFSSWFLQSSA